MRNSEFITGKVPITKEEVRAISISKLNLVNAKNLIDIGAGTGSVSVEAAYNYPNLKVISIEKNDDAIELIEKNKKKFNLKNIEVIKGYAPINLGLNVKVESIFLGGTGNNLEEIIEWSKKNLVTGGDL
ncbi:precorrin-6Y C5,15-methyltransferase (decarboxylating) subunit CbiT [Clostridioides difficile]|uniref:precorrin-6Y C5,15-methyltransferase (decarboxylating) subunit CbiT n=1 Tax=Clostridioides difficile TaxID=1496 RepID=UPI00355B0FA9